MKVLLEMRPALYGHAGLPQATRLLFRGLCLLDGVEVEGLIQSSGHVLTEGLPEVGIGQLSTDEAVNRLSRVVISLEQNMSSPHLAGVKMVLHHLLGGSQRLSRFESRHFRDFIWRAFFAPTLPPQDFDLVTRANFRVAQVPWVVMHRAALITRRLGAMVYPRLDTTGFDVMISETPYPARVARGTQLVVRYHDAIPMLMPHTISDKTHHQAQHYRALRDNVRRGALFACVSEATRNDLLAIFPEVEKRSVTIHNIVSHHYFREKSDPTRVPEIVNTRAHEGVKKLIPNHAQPRPATDAAAREAPMDYLFMVSTIEPRKNHLTLLAAWEVLRAAALPDLKLVLVGILGWSYEAIVKAFQPWIEQGNLFILENVPSPELRLLYAHARATVCPSFHEGFDFSGVEAMRCGGVVVASDIPVHREIYGRAAEYFSTYSAEQLAQAVTAVSGPDNTGRRAELVDNGDEVSSRYAFESILPQWDSFLKSLPGGTPPKGATQS